MGECLESQYCNKNKKENPQLMGPLMSLPRPFIPHPGTCHLLAWAAGSSQAADLWLLKNQLSELRPGVRYGSIERPENWLQAKSGLLLRIQRSMRM